jgi:outer membrane receptor protein involved in Fe transport
LSREDRQEVWNAGFFFQNVLDISDRYFVTVGARVDGNSAFGSGFGLQLYPKGSASWVASDEAFWRESWGQVKLRAAYGQSGKAPGAFDAVRTWQSQGFLGESAFVPRNVGDPDLGPEVSSELELGLDASWLSDRISATITYYDQTTSDALFNVAQTPSEGFGGNQRLNVGTIGNSGIELTLNTTPLQRESWSWDLGVDLTTHHSEVLDLGGAPPFSVSGGYVAEGHPAPVRRVRIVTNPDEIAAPKFENNVYLGPTSPTVMWGLNTTVHLPAGIALSARGDYRGGFYWADGASSGAVSRSVRWPICNPYYKYPQGIVSQEPFRTSVELKPETPAIWRARCNPSTGNNDMYTVKGDYFRLRSVTASMPLDFAFPDRVTSSTLTLGLYNSYTWYNDEFLLWDPEMAGDPDGLVDSPGMRMPIPIALRASLQVQF